MDDDVRTVTELNARFIEAFRVGSLEMLDEVLDDGFIYLDGATGDTAVVTGRTTRDGQSFSRYVDTWRRVNGRWTCVHGGLWPVPPQG